MEENEHCMSASFTLLDCSDVRSYSAQARWTSHGEENDMYSLISITDSAPGQSRAELQVNVVVCAWLQFSWQKSKFSRNIPHWLSRRLQAFDWFNHSVLGYFIKFYSCMIVFMLVGSCDVPLFIFICFRPRYKELFISNNTELCNG